MKKGVKKLATKLLSLTLVLGMVFCSSTIRAATAGNVADSFLNDDWTPGKSGNMALGRSAVSGRSTMPTNANVIVGIFGGEFHDLDLNDGCITLANDLVVSGSLVSNDGTITHTFPFISGYSVIISFNKDQVLNNKITFTADITLDFNGCEFDLNSTGTFAVGVAGSRGNTLTLRNMTLKGLHSNATVGLLDSWIVFNHVDSRLIFDNVKIDGSLHLNEQELQKVSGDFEFI